MTAAAAAAAGGCTGMAAGAATPAAGGFLEFWRRFARRIGFAVGDDGFALGCLLADFGAPVFEPDLKGRATHGKFYQNKPFLPLKNPSDKIILFLILLQDERRRWMRYNAYI
jgi:hypothetical protein